jgi:hypothetical protein
VTDTIFVIEELWTDEMENETARAIGYSAVGFVEDEQLARKLVADAGVAPKKTMWAMFEDMPRKRYKPLTLLKPPGVWVKYGCQPR